MGKKKNRKIVFWSTERPVTSERVKYIISSSNDSEAFVTAVRNSRKKKSTDTKFKVSEETQSALSE